MLLPLPIGQFFQIHGSKLMFAEAISQALTRSDPDFAVCQAESPSDTVRLCRSMAAYAVIMEVTAYTPWRLAERLAKKDGLADNFIYGSVSPDYLAAVMDAL